jgi:hypothetical protein
VPRSELVNDGLGAFVEFPGPPAAVAQAQGGQLDHLG